MKGIFSKIILVLPLFVLFIILSSPAISADNATITGDGVRMRNYPYASGNNHVLKSLNSGTRIEVLERTDSTDTIEGHTAPWYKIKHVGNTGYVFGKYVELDEGISIYVIDPSSIEYFNIQLIRFVYSGLYAFGTKDSEIIEKLGQPISVTEYKGFGIFEGEIYHRLTYEGISFELYGPAGEGSIWAMRCATNLYEFSGFRVGSPVEDVKCILGKPNMIGDGMIRYRYSSEKDTFMNPDQIEGDILTYYNFPEAASFRIINGKVTEIAIYFDAYD